MSAYEVVAPIRLGDAGAKATLFAIAHFAGSDGRGCAATVASIAAIADSTPRTVQRNLRKLLSAGIIAEGTSNALVDVHPAMRPNVYDIVSTEARRVACPDPDWATTAEWRSEGALPARGANVVYVLHDDQRAVAYIGSTGDLPGRLAEHRREGRLWPTWTWVAKTFPNRSAAYAAEHAYLSAHKPYLNRRAAA